ncbi:TetR/AcrR family transcriptional regulator [Nocardioides jishulii]|uniref:Helix-turn-helix transcriptional regulator n=1 Tax=Nocardioides jishulii TaxID=2575440 RepID=A0A4V5TK92_9ACTN|nr:TetR family transcriptional regulator [Nocardioides jishulii]QCX27836.1 helix-turn-helix transcriptional regulator [Nocardioides jishulii]TKI62643.1 helix-turn-helix transcriptional regulator [Nocardioides jishulii]
MRADAARRRARIIDEARRLFAAYGGGVALETVAEAAQVGIATLYRNFESRSALGDEVAQAILGDMRAAAQEALAGDGAMTAASWDAYVRRLVDLDLGALTAALAEHADDAFSEAVRMSQDVTLAGVEEVLAAARAADCVRDDIGALELVVLIGMITRPQAEAVHRAAPDLVEHLLAVVLDGMRPPR